MIECKIRRDKNCRVKASGTPKDLTSELLYLIHEMYNGIKKENEPLADEFRRNLIGTMIDPNSPIFK